MMRRLARLLYNHNPFYPISAALVLHGLRQATAGPDPLQAWGLLACLAGYTLLLAAAATLVVRWLRVWEDARTIVLTVVLLLLASSVCFDEIALDRTRTGAPVLLAGLALAAALSEALLRGLRLRLPLLFRLPYHALLALFFLYPLLLGGLVDGIDAGDKQPLALALLGFPAAASMLLLGLLPAVRRGAGYVADNGTPWGWPLYPWSLFVVLLVGVGLRSYLLCVSFFPGGTPFGAFFLWPLPLAVAALLLEMAWVHGLPGLRRLALALPWLALVLAVSGAGGQERFLALVPSPLWCAALGLLGLQAVAWLRGERAAEAGLVAALVLLSFAGPRAILLSAPSAPLLLALAALLLVRSWFAPHPLRAWLALAALLGAASCGGGWFVAWRGALPWNLLVAGTLAIGHALRDRRLRAAGITGLALLLVGALAQRGAIPAWLLLPYALSLVALPALCWWIEREPLALRVLAFNGGLLALHLLDALRRLAREDPPPGLLALLCGGACLLAALAISMAKGGVWRKLLARE